MVDIQCAAAEIRRGKKLEDRKKPQDENIMACPIPQGGHNDCTQLQQPRRRRDKTPEHTINVPLYWWHQLASHASGLQYTSLILVNHGVNINEAYAVTTGSARHTIRSEANSSSFRLQQDNAPAHTALKAISFLTHNFAVC